MKKEPGAPFIASKGDEVASQFNRYKSLHRPARVSAELKTLRLKRRLTLLLLLIPGLILTYNIPLLEDDIAPYSTNINHMGISGETCENTVWHASRDEGIHCTEHDNFDVGNQRTLSKVEIALES